MIAGVKTLLGGALWVVLATPWAACADDVGQRLFASHCAPCHGNRGEGGIGATLATPQLLHAPDPSDNESLRAVIVLGLPGTGMPPTRMTVDESQALVRYVRALGRIEPQSLPGDVARGARIFAEQLKCGDCHAVGMSGGSIGSDLTAVGARRSPAFLRRAILDPASAVTDRFIVYQRYISFPRDFLQVRILTNDGRRITGSRLDEDAFSIQVRDYSGKLHSLLKSEIKELHKDRGETPMPSVRGVLKDSDIDDLVAYLASLRGSK